MVVTLSGSRVAFVAYAGAYTALALVALQSAIARLVRLRHRPRDLKLAIATAKAVMALAFAADGIGHVLLNMPGVTTDAACLARTRFTQLAFVAGYVMAMGVLLARAHQIAGAMQLWRRPGAVRKPRAVETTTTTTPRYTACGAGYAHVLVWIVYALLGTIDVTILRSCLDSDGDADSGNSPLASSYCHWSPNPVVYTARRLLDLAIESYLCLVAVYGLWIQRKAEPAEFNSTLQFAKALSVSYAPRAAVLMLNVVSDLYILWANAYNVAVPFGWLASNVLVMLFVAYDEELVRATLRGLRKRKQPPPAPAAAHAKDDSGADVPAPISRAPPPVGDDNDDIDGNARTRVLVPSAATRAITSLSDDDPPSSPTSSGSSSSDDATRGRARRGMYHAAPATMTTMTVPSSPPTATGRRRMSSTGGRAASPVWARGAWPPPLPFPPSHANAAPAPGPAAPPTTWDPATMAAAYAAAATAAAAAAALRVEAGSTPVSSSAAMSPAAAALALMSPDQVNAVMALAAAAAGAPRPRQEVEAVVATAWPAEPARIRPLAEEGGGGRWGPW
ncbi:hypothetical protein GGF32_003303 [Allomyces javanicus]|nr:hypothetical protein GGF32_003303 [Allomyces javanicus]